MIMTEKNPVMVEAGFKAWQTRLENERKAKNRKRALKAWRTMRARV